MVGKTVYWGNMKGIVSKEGEYYVHVLFGESMYEFDKYGRIYKNMPSVLSFVPYDIPKFEQPIEKDTFVWCKQSERNCWSARYYSHMEDGVHYCFTDQLKSHQTNSNPMPWNIVQTESPFTHD
jgi:hypothetical protein